MIILTLILCIGIEQRHSEGCQQKQSRLTHNVNQISSIFIQQIPNKITDFGT